MTNIEKTYNFLNETGTYYLATIDNGKPKVRPFGTILCDNNKLYIQTGKIKDVAHQLSLNQNAEICAFNGDKWVRISCILKENGNKELKIKMLDKMPSLRAMYNENDNNMLMLEICNATVTFCSFTSDPETFKL